jgi:D-serine deaminase-like pyridoxal phosphate-dependent protein
VPQSHDKKVNFAEDPISIFYKGMPLSSRNQSERDFLASSPNLFISEFQFPVMILRDSALRHNINRMASYCKSIGFELAPHVKTPMSPQIAELQMAAGAWGLTIANFFQAQIMFEFGFTRLIIGNEVVEPSSIAEISRINGSGLGEIFFYIDSLAGLRIAQNAIANVPEAKLNVFMEIGAPGGRAGIRDFSLLEQLLEEIDKDDRIWVRGVSGFEGAVPEGDREELGIKILREFLCRIVEAARITQPYLRGNKIIISAGGSSYFDYVAEEFAKFKGEAEFILRSGSYVTHDHIHYEFLNPFMNEQVNMRLNPALELWARVLSVPEPNLAIVNFGKRDVGNDLDEPQPIFKFDNGVKPFDAKVKMLNDQHAFVHISPGSVEVGDIVAFGISHPCTNFDKWRLLPLVDDDYNVIDLFHTYF